VPLGERASFFEGVARAVRVGGTLLFSAHAPNSGDRPANPELYFTAEEVVRSLTHGRWEIVLAGENDHDSVVNARRTL
jgi:hypothetical protein